MRRFSNVFACFLFAFCLKFSEAHAQVTTTALHFSHRYEFVQLYQLDSLGNSNSIASYFGSLYFQFLQSIEKQLQPADSATKDLVRKFEKVFAQFYIDAANAHELGQPILVKEWQEYFSHSDLQPIQYKLLGANAHLNGGLWQAITNSFTKEEMGSLKEEFVIFKRSLNQTYKFVYTEAIRENKKLNRLNKFSLGFLFLPGNYYLYKWRRRQMRLARLYWNNSPQYSSLLKKIEQKKKKIDRLIIETL